MLKCTVTNLAECILPFIYADIPTMIYGATGIGKSSIIRNDIIPAIARKYGSAVLHDIRLSTKDIVDGTGMPIIDPNEKATYWTRPAFIPKDDGQMHVFFFDEFGHASVQLQQMSYSLILDRGLGGYPLPKKNRILLATNTRADGGGDNKMLKPLQNRMMHVTAEVDHPGFLEKMKHWGWDMRLIAFLSIRSEEIHKVSDEDPAFPTPRSVEMFDKVLKELGVNASKMTIENTAQASVGNAFARQFGVFLGNLLANLPKMADILANPMKAKVPTDPQHQYIVGSAVSKNINKETVNQFTKYLERLMPEVSSMAAHDAITRDQTMKEVKSLTSLITEASVKGSK